MPARANATIIVLEKNNKQGTFINLFFYLYHIYQQIITAPSSSGISELCYNGYAHRAK